MTITRINNFSVKIIGQETLVFLMRSILLWNPPVDKIDIVTMCEETRAYCAILFI